jgi:hypothetical protein
MHLRSVVMVGLLLALAGCGDGAFESANARGGADNAGVLPGSGSAGAGAGNPTTSPPGSIFDPSAPGSMGAGGAGSIPVLPAEIEVKLDFELPQASQRFVYAANPESGTVVIIDAETLTIQTVETGDRPTFLQTLRGTDDAIVLNAGSDDATMMRSPETKLTTSTVDVVPGANVIAVAPDGKHAVVYFNALYSSAGSATGSFQDVTVLTLEPGKDRGIGMTVGFRPREVVFAADGSAAFAVTDDGVSVLDFATIDDEGAGIARLVTLGADVDQKSLDVSISPDGRYALARQPSESSIRLVDLSKGKIQTLELADLELPDPDADPDVDAGTGEAPVEITDLDLAPNGEFALAVLRNQDAVVRIPVPEAFEDHSKLRVYTIPGQLFGSVEIAPEADRALLYTTAAELERITILPLTGDEEPHTVALRKLVQAVAMAPDGKTALIMHAKLVGDPNEPGIDPDAMIDRKYGYSVLRLSTGDVKLQVTDIPAKTFTITPDGGLVFLLFRDDASFVREVHEVDAASFLVEKIRLGSPPISLGAVPSSERLFVNQEHPDGRITLIDWKTNEQRTVTGFELNSRIRD